MEMSSEEASDEEENEAVPDGGWGWVVVFGAFLINVITDGCSYSFGVLFTNLVDYFHASRSKTAWIGSVFNAAPLLCGPIASVITKRYGFRKATVAGGLLATVGMISSAFANSIELLCFTYGIVSGFGISLPYLASSVVVMTYFNKRKSLATGLSECGAGIGTLVFAPLLQCLIVEYGWRGTLLILGGIVLNIVVCGSLFRPVRIIKQNRCEGKSLVLNNTLNGTHCSETSNFPKDVYIDENLENGYHEEPLLSETIVSLDVPGAKNRTSFLGGSLSSLTKVTKVANFDSICKDNDSTTAEKTKRTRLFVDVSVLRDWRFLVFLTSNFILYFWYDVPYVFTVDRAVETGESEPRGALIVSCVGILHTIGNILFGFIGDLKRTNRTILYCVSMWFAGGGLVLVPVSRHFVSFSAFAGAYGLFSAASEALSCVLVVDILGLSKISDAYGILMFLQGIANLIGPPFAGWLYHLSGFYDNTFLAAGVCIIFTGILFIVVPIQAQVKHYCKHQQNI